MPAPSNPKLYHIVHVDRLPSIAKDGELQCDALIANRAGQIGTTIGMNDIKRRRLSLPIPCHPTLMVGQCVPFYFCPRSIMLYLLHRANHAELSYRGGQQPIVHLEFDLQAVVNWAANNNRRWSFTLSNAGAYYFESRNDLNKLGDLDWPAIQTNRWSGQGVSPSVKEGKQAEFLTETSVNWSLVQRIGVYSQDIAQQVSNALHNAPHRPPTVIMTAWYY
jgi:hypothetical protein